MNLEAKVRVAVGTQTDECPSFLARKEAQTADASPLPVPPDFQPERQSTPLPADAMELGEDQLPEVERSLTDDITMEVDEQEPGAESDATFHLTAELSFARYVINPSLLVLCTLALSRNRTSACFQRNHEDETIACFMQKIAALE